MRGQTCIRIMEKEGNKMHNQREITMALRFANSMEWHTMHTLCQQLQFVALNFASLISPC